ncbi:MAG TPA: DUF6766 family protein [Gaiellaceae bacterium]|nr:DUF6766 family protein [Gaiellaceae bacterium]
MRVLKENGLSVFFAALFAVTVSAQSFAGQRNFNAEQLEHGGEPVSWWGYVTTSDFWGAVMENWQSEFLQFAVFIGATVWLVQKGSNESKELQDVGLESDEDQRLGRHATASSPLWARTQGLRNVVYRNSLLLVMTTIFLASWLAQSLNNWRVFNEEQRQHSEPTVAWARYLADPDFWEKTLQNWQSEFLAVGAMVVFTIYLRQRGSPESKPAGAPHDETASSG